MIGSMVLQVGLPTSPPRSGGSDAVRLSDAPLTGLLRPASDLSKLPSPEPQAEETVLGAAGGLTPQLTERDGRRCVFTISAWNQYGFVRVLFESIDTASPDIQCLVWFVSDESEPQQVESAIAARHGEVRADFAQRPAHWRIVGLDELQAFLENHMADWPALRLLAARYTLVEFATAVKPYAFEYMLVKGGARAAMYLDNDILVTAPLTSVFDLLDHRSVVVTPHITQPFPWRDGHKQTEQDIVRSGVLRHISYRKADAPF